MDAFVKALWGALRATCVFHKDEKNPHGAVMESVEKHMFQLLNQIDIVEEIKMAVLQDGYIPRRLIKWVKEATYLKSQVCDALKTQQTSEDPLLKNEELKDKCNKMFDCLKHCPVEDIHDKPIAFIAWMHETDSSSLQSEDELQAQDVEKEVPYSSDLSERASWYDIITTLNESAPLPKLRSESENLELVGETAEGQSFQVNELDGRLEISFERSISSSSIVQVQYENIKKLEIIEEGSPPQGIVEQENASRRRREKMPINGVSDPNDVLDYSNEEHEKRVLIKSESNQYELPIKISSYYSQEEKRDGECVAGPSQSDLSELGTIILISVSKYEKLGLEILTSAASQETDSLNCYFGLDPKMENYLFSAMKKPGVEYPIVNRSGSGTVDEWREAVVVNLIEKIVLLPEEPDCPNLALLFLQRNNRLAHIPPSFFNQMPALSFLDLSNTRIKELPTSLFALKNLQVLLLRSCVCLKSLPADVKNLKKVEVLDVLGTDLHAIPKEIGELMQLRHLHLSFYGPEYGTGYARFPSELISPGVISKLQALQALSIVVHPEDQRWKKIVSDVINHVARLEKLSYLEFYFPIVEALRSFIDESPSWKEQTLVRFKFIVGHNIKRITSRVPDEVESKYDQHDRCLRFVNGTQVEVPKEMKTVLISVTAFYLDHHLEIQSLSDFDNPNFKELRFCVVRECPSMKVVIIGDERSESFFPNLEYLGLHYLWDLERIWEDPMPPGSFKALKYLMVGTCRELKYIASRSILECLSNLETFIIEDCEKLESVVREKEMVKSAPLLPRLRELELRHLPHLVALGSGLFPSQEMNFITHYCPKLILRPGVGTKKFLGSLLYCNICPKLEIRNIT